MKGCVHPVLVGFGDCDPAGIVYYPNFFRWFDDATQALLRASGRGYGDMQREHGWILGPVVDVGAKFLAPARYGEQIEIHARIERWTGKTFRLAHRVLRGDALLAEGWEVRFIGIRTADDPPRLQALPIPDWFRAPFVDTDAADDGTGTGPARPG